jgi:hypothetical protein
MELQDGFIVGVYNYCDAWCAACRLTSYCRVFADRAAMEAQADPNLKPVTDAPLLPEEEPPPPPRWMQEFLDDLVAASKEPLTPEEIEASRPKPPEAHLRIAERAKIYGQRVHDWLRSLNDARDTLDAGNPVDVIAWFSYFIAAKVHRAINRLATWSDDTDEVADHNGSAKVALEGIGRSHAAWLALVEQGTLSLARAYPFIVDLVWLGQAVEEVFPKAREFVRSGLDEPEDVAKMLGLTS